MLAAHLRRFILIFALLSSAQFAIANQSDDRVQQFGIKFAKALSEQDVDTLASMFDTEEFGNIIAKSIFDRENEIADFVNGFKNTNQQAFTRRLFQNWFQLNSKAKFLRIKNGHALVRLDMPESGHDYLLLVNSQSNPHQFSDIFTATGGKHISKTIAEVTGLMLKPSDSMVKKLFGIKQVDDSVLESIKNIVDLRREQEFQKAYDATNKLPEEIKNQRVIVDLSVALSQNIDDETYYKELARLDKLFGNDPSTAFMLIDFHFLSNNFEKTQSSFDLLIDHYGVDAALLNLKANSYLVQKNFKEALKLSQEASTLEADFEDSHWTTLTAFVELRDFENTVKELQYIEEAFGYQFAAENFMEEELYSEFIKSKEFKRWFQ